MLDSLLSVIAYNNLFESLIIQWSVFPSTSRSSLIRLILHREGMFCVVSFALCGLFLCVFVPWRTCALGGAVDDRRAYF